MAGWHQWLDGRESEWALGVGDRHGCLACCNSWGRKESDTTEQLNWTDALSTKLKATLLATLESLQIHIIFFFPYYRYTYAYPHTYLYTSPASGLGTIIA